MWLNLDFKFKIIFTGNFKTHVPWFFWYEGSGANVNFCSFSDNFLLLPGLLSFRIIFFFSSFWDSTCVLIWVCFPFSVWPSWVINHLTLQKSCELNCWGRASFFGHHCLDLRLKFKDFCAWLQGILLLFIWLSCLTFPHSILPELLLIRQWLELGLLTFKLLIPLTFCLGSWENP